MIVPRCVMFGVPGQHPICGRVVAKASVGLAFVCGDVAEALHLVPELLLAQRAAKHGQAAGC
jgi:hypothetical protein